MIVKATVTRNADNRWLHIEAESGSFYRSSEIQLDGDRAPLITEIRLNNLPGGEYTVRAVLRNNLGEETIVRRTALVLAASRRAVVFRSGVQLVVTGCAGPQRGALLG